MKEAIYDFDTMIAREQTDCVKYDLRQDTFGKEDVIPMWVADMDFETPDFITNAVAERAKHPIYGYTIMSDAYFDSVINWVKIRHSWDIKKEWISFTPGVVPGVNYAIHAFTEKGDGIIIQTPVYFPFGDSIKQNGRKVIENQLLLKNGRYTIDFEDLEKKTKQAKMILLSSPHNPVGRCWSLEELKALADICVRNNVIIVSDEIHNDLIIPGYQHIPTATLSDEIAEMTVTCIAPSKTFNIAGLATSSIIIQNAELREKFQKFSEQIHVSRGNLFGYVASVAAYQKGASWVDQLMRYVKNNFDYLASYLKSEIPQIEIIEMEATYLAWIDFRKTGLSDSELRRKLIFEAELGLSPGTIFGSGGQGFQRMNLAAPFKTIETACGGLKKAFG
ncbi:MAG: putative C-S lyase [Bacteroidales bacterium]|nr:putative C-S lyase [Bacteroidales bacterium]